MTDFIELHLALLADGISRGVPVSSEDLEYLRKRGGAEGQTLFSITFPLLGRAVDGGLVGGTFVCPTNFKKRQGTLLPSFLHLVFQRCFDVSGTLREKPCIQSIRFLRQFLLLGSKLESDPTPIQCEQAWNGFCERQRKLRSLSLPKTDTLLVAKQLLTRVLKGLNLRNISPRHGPGGVFERVPQDHKWDFRTWPKRAERFYPYVEYGVHLAPLGRVRKDSLVRFVENSTTRVCLVPKDFRGPRLISAESVVTQYLQQGQMSLLMRRIGTNGLLRKSIKLEDQTFNQYCALESYDQDRVTLDLSNASDTVSCTLVWYLLSGVPDLRRCLFATRSQFATYRGKKERIVAFAPMGSAVCFPIETLVFWSLAMSACKEDPVFRHESWDEIAQQVAVFGDDIIVPRTTLNFLTNTLISVGCEPSMSKTCWKTPFRESCGSEWFNNQDVSIIRNRRIYHVKQKDTTAEYYELLRLSRGFFSRQWYSSASLLANWAGKIHPIIQRDFDRERWEERRRLRWATSLPKHLRRFLLSKTLSKVQSTFVGLTEWGLPEFLVRSLLDKADGGSHLETFVSWLEPAELNQFPVTFSSTLHDEPVSRFCLTQQRLLYSLPKSLQKTRKWGPSSEQRLLARLLGDRTERIPLLGCKSKKGWIWVPNKA